MAKKLPARLQEILKDIGLTERQAVWDCHGTPVVLHKALEKVAAHYNVVFDQPQIIACDVAAKEAVICVTGHMAEATEWSIGEAAPYNNKNSYPFAMAEKRAKDRVILKLVGLHGDVYSEEEADDFKAAKPKQATPAMELDLASRVDAALTFYENCDAQRFASNESRYKKLINSPDLSEPQYEQLVEAHDKRKTELMV
jgi:hypothetical protein